MAPCDEIVNNSASLYPGGSQSLEFGGYWISLVYAPSPFVVGIRAMSNIITSEAGKFSIRLSGTIANLILVGTIAYLREHTRLRTFSALLAAVLLVLGSGTYIVGSYELGRLSAPMLFGGVGLLMAAILSGNQFGITIGDTSAEMEKAAAEERKAAEQNVRQAPGPYTSLELETARINEYYTINQAQARGSFRWAVFAMFCGLATIVAGVWTFYFRKSTPDTFLTSLTTAAGIVVNVISALYLYLHNRTQKRSLFYYGQLGRLQEIGIAIRVAETHDDADAKKRARDKIIDQLLSLVKLSAEKDGESLRRDAE